MLVPLDIFDPIIPHRHIYCNRPMRRMADRWVFRHYIPMHTRPGSLRLVTHR